VNPKKAPCMGCFFVLRPLQHPNLQLKPKHTAN
jgi:hypothetical protein